MVITEMYRRKEGRKGGKEKAFVCEEFRRHQELFEETSNHSPLDLKNCDSFTPFKVIKLQEKEQLTEGLMTKLEDPGSAQSFLTLNST